MKAAGILGGMLWASPLIAMTGALLTGLLYASLGSRYPRAGGAAYIITTVLTDRSLVQFQPQR